MTISATGTYTDVTFPAGDNDHYRWTITPLSNPTPDGYFWAHQFGMADGDGGYVGLQTLGSGLPGRCVVFSIFGAIDATGPGVVDDDADGFPGYSTRTTYMWMPHVSYRFDLTKGTTVGDGQWWDATVTNLSNGVVTEIASIKVPSSWGGLNANSVCWTERYAGPTGSCSDLQHSIVEFTDFTADGAAPTGFSNHLSDPVGCPNSSITAIHGGARQEVGTLSGGAPYTPSPTFAPVESPTKVEIWSADLTTRLVESVPFYGEDLSTDHPVSETGVIVGRIGLDEDAMEHLVEGNRLRVTIAGEPVITARIQPEIRYQHVHLDGPVSQVAEFSFPGQVAELDDCPVNAYGGVDAKPQSTERPFTWCSPEADLTLLEPATVLYPVLSQEWQSPQTDPPWFKPWLPPRGMADPYSSWIWASAPDPVTGHPPQTRRFVNDIEIAEDGLYLFQCAADDGFKLFGNGDELGKGNDDPADSFVRCWQGVWALTAGKLRVGIEGYNYARPTVAPVGTFGGPNVGRVAFTLYHLPDGVNTVLSNDLVVARTDDTWLTLDTDDPLPAPTWDVIVEELIYGALLDGMKAAQGWSVVPVGTLSQQGDQSFKIDEDTILSVLRQGSTSGCIDWLPDSSEKVIYVADFGTLGSPHAATYTEADGTLLDLQERSIPGFCNSLVVRHKTGRKIVEDAGSIAAVGRFRRALPLADLSEDAATAQARRELAIRAVPRSSFTAAIEVDVGTANAPYGDGGPRPGDSPNFRTDEIRMVRISTTFDAGGYPTFVPELKTRLQGEAERRQIALSKAGSSLDGTSRAATALEGIPTKTVAGFIRDADDIVFSQIQLTPTGQEALYDVTNPRKYKHPARAWRADYTQFVPPQDVDTIVDVILSTPAGTSTLATVVLPVGLYHATTLIWYGHIGELDNVHAVWRQHDTAIDDPDHPDLDARWGTLTLAAVDANPASVEAPAVEVPW